MGVTSDTARGTGPPPGRRPPTKGELTRRAILDASAIRFGREGFRSTSVADIARDAGVGGTVPYAYFPNKDALFFAALDEDAASVIREGLTSVMESGDIGDWRQTLVFTLVDAVDRHPLAGRVLGGLEPDVIDRVLEIPALADLRRACADRLRIEQIAGTVRPDIDPVVMGNGVVAIVLSLMMSVVQLGRNVAGTYADDVTAVFTAALEVAPPIGPTPRRPATANGELGGTDVELTSAAVDGHLTASRESTTTGRRPIAGSSDHQTSPRLGSGITSRPQPRGMMPGRPTRQVP